MCALTHCAWWAAVSLLPSNTWISQAAVGPAGLRWPVQQQPQNPHTHVMPGAVYCICCPTCCRDVLAGNSSRGLELLGTLTACLQDPSPGVAALGLSSLALLLERDDLDFYKAWPVVAKLLPPTKILTAMGVDSTACNSAAAAAAGQKAGDEEDADQGDRHISRNDSYNCYCDMGKAVAAAGCHTGLGVAAAGWVGLLRYGALDAAVHAELAPALLQLMWMSTGAQQAQVRGRERGKGQRGRELWHIGCPSWCQPDMYI